MSVSFSHLTKKYKKRIAVDDFSLEVEAPVFGFLGENGAGKTTIMKMIVGLLEPTSGTITIDGALSADPSTKEKMGFMPETPYFYERFTGLDFLEFCDGLFEKNRAHLAEAASLGKPNSTQVSRGKHYEDLLKKVGLAQAGSYEIRTYSKGMRQRLAFAQALVNDPAYLFLDEPLDGLDPLGRQEMKTVMRELKSEGRKIFLNTHILYDVEEVCDELGVIHKGKLLYAGPVKDFCSGKSLEERFVETIQKQDKEVALF
jgi:ABC-2 type transport system ATP-binding protein